MLCTIDSSEKYEVRLQYNYDNFTDDQLLIQVNYCILEDKRITCEITKSKDVVIFTSYGHLNVSFDVYNSAMIEFMDLINKYRVLLLKLLLTSSKDVPTIIRRMVSKEHLKIFMRGTLTSYGYFMGYGQLVTSKGVPVSEKGFIFIDGDISLDSRYIVRNLRIICLDYLDNKGFGHYRYARVQRDYEVFDVDKERTLYIQDEEYIV